MKHDLRFYSDNELSLMVFNDEGLYNIRKSTFLFELLEEQFLFTEKQKEVLEDDLESEEN